MLNSAEHKVQLLIKSKMLKKIFFAFKLSYDVFILPINFKMPTSVGILTIIEDKFRAQLS